MVFRLRRRAATSEDEEQELGGAPGGNEPIKRFIETEGRDPVFQSPLNCDTNFSLALTEIYFGLSRELKQAEFLLEDRPDVVKKLVFGLFQFLIDLQVLQIRKDGGT
jgi:hypothetical protein